MGLDMYLKAKTKLFDKSTNYTGACGGLFPFAPEYDNMTEIGYWRKAYSVAELISLIAENYDNENDNCENIELSLNECKQILARAKENLKDIDNEWELYDWKKTIEFFTKAIDILKQDKNAEIYYYQWY